MSTSLTSALLDQDTGGIYRRHDVKVMDTSSTSLPAASATAPTVDGVVLTHGDKVLFTALTSGANVVYTLHLDKVNGQSQYSFYDTTDHRYTSDARGPAGAPESHDVMRVLEGTHANALLMWDGSTWSTPDVADSAAVATSIATATAPHAGATGSRPVTPATGYMYFDTTLGKPVWWNGSAWKDATGTTA